MAAMMMSGISSIYRFCGDVGSCVSITWGRRTVRVLAGLASLTILYLFLGKIAQNLKATFSEPPREKVEEFKSKTVDLPPFVKEAFSGFSKWLEEKIEEISSWTEDSGSENTLKWTRRQSPLKDLHEEMKKNIGGFSVTDHSTGEEWTLIQKVLANPYSFKISTEGSAPQFISKEVKQASGRERAIFDEGDEKALCDVLRECLVRLKLLAIKFQKSLEVSLQSHLSRMRFLIVVNLDAYLNYLTEGQTDGACFGMARENFFKVGLYKMEDMDVLQLREYDGDLKGLRQDVVILQWAQEHTGKEVSSIIEKAQQDMKEKIQCLQTRIQSDLRQVANFKGDVTIPLNAMQKELKNLSDCLAQSSINHSMVEEHLKKILSQDKKRQAALLKSYILQQDIQFAWYTLQRPSLAQYYKDYQLNDPFLLYNLGQSITDPRLPRYTRLTS